MLYGFLDRKIGATHPVEKQYQRQLVGSFDNHGDGRGTLLSD